MVVGYVSDESYVWLNFPDFQVANSKANDNR